MNYLEKKFVTTTVGDICYFKDSSFPGRPCIVLLHGLSSNHTTWLNIIQELHERGYNSIALDLRGHGHSDKRIDKKIYTWERFARDVKAVLDAEHVERCVMVGYSFGGVITQEFLSLYPGSVSGVILISSNHKDPLGHVGLGFLVPVARGILNFISFVFRLQRRKNFYYYQHGKPVGYWDSVFDGLTTMPISVNLWMLALYARFDYRKVLSGLSMPIYLVCAQKDPFLSIKEVSDMSGKIPNSKLIISRNPSHFIASQVQDEVTDIIIDFLAQYGS